MADIVSNLGLQKEELETLQAIYPEALIELDSSRGEVQLLIDFDDTLILTSSEPDNKCSVSSLPNVLFKFYLPENYPSDECCEFEIISEWLPTQEIEKLNEILIKLWEDFHDSVLYMMIDTLRTEVSVFIELNMDKCLLVEPNTLIKLEYLDIEKKKADFNKMTFTCDICQETKRGIKCLRFDECQHVFCLNCLQDYFKEILQAGDVEKVHCPAFDCTKHLLNKHKKLLDASRHEDKLKEWQIKLFEPPLPKEVLLKIAGLETVDNFMTKFKDQRFLLFKKEFPLKVLECPRTNCKKTFIGNNDNEFLAICPECNFAFCRECRHSWHGTMNTCKSKPELTIPEEAITNWLDSEKDSLTRTKISMRYGRRLMNIAVNAYLAEEAMKKLLLDEKSDIQLCPYCNMLIERSDGCNKMRCSACGTMFCNICGDLLSSTDPYLHFHSLESPCYGRLFDGIIKDE